MNDGHENGQASVLFLYSPPSKGFPCQYPQIMRRPFWKAAPRFRRIPRGRPAGHAEAGPCELSHRRLHHEDGASLAPGAPPWAADSSESMRRRQRRRLRPPSSASLTSGYGREGTHPRISESEGRPPGSRQAAVFRSRNNIRVPKNERPRRKAGSGSSWSGRRDSNPRIQAWEAWALPLGDARMREGNYSAPFPVREETHISTWLIGLPAEDAEGDFSHPPPNPRRSHYRNTGAD